MGERYFQKDPVDIWTGQNERFLKALKKRIREAEKVDVIVSFIMESGVQALLEELKEVRNLRILTGSYLNITEPWALRTLKEECQKTAELRFFDNPAVSFHPKSWIFHYSDHIEVIVGSSNLSRSALTEGVEWNCLLKGEDARAFSRKFDQLFQNEALEITDEVLDRYYKQWKKPSVNIEQKTSDRICPRGIQTEALYALEHARENGVNRALIEAATGTGKTYLAAFDSGKFGRTLFVAHRKEILDQAQRSFRIVSPEKSQGRIDQNHKDTGHDLIFASVHTLSNMVKEGKLGKDDFDYIVIDEFHHAVADSYRTVVDYFTPEFLLGLTATPDRLDGRDVYALCDYNVPFSITLQDAINKGVLCPFRYYGIFDETDYSSVPFRNGKYSSSELNRLYRQAGKRTELILKHYLKYEPTRTLAFCATRQHADDMAEAFNKAGIPSAAVHSTSDTRRDEAIEALKNEQIRVIFSVDMFNEGVDIPDVDMVMMLRPTESPTVFLQQLGRGLRHAKNKPWLTVLDFIGNYHNAGRIPELLTGEKTRGWGERGMAVPQGCYIDFDLRLIDLFREMNMRKKGNAQLFLEEYKRIEKIKSRRPTRMDLFTEMDGDLLDAMRRGPNPLHSYFDWLHDHGYLTKQEEIIFNSKARDLIRELEKTSMSRLYKMPVLMSFPDGNSIRKTTNYGLLLESWKQFFSGNDNWHDLPGVSSYRQFLKITDKEHLANIKKNPLKFLDKSSHGIFVKTEDGLSIGEPYQEYLQDESLVQQWRDILAFRTMEYRRNRLEARNEVL